MDLGDAERLARELMAEHRLTGWRFAWDRAVRRAGSTRFRDRTITLSRRLTELHDEHGVRETILHEIAHALVGPRHGHDATWRRTALAIGASGERCLAEDSPQVEGRWLGVCPAGHETRRHRTPTRVASCTRCSPRFDLAHVYRWTRDGEPVAMHPAYAAELRRLRAEPERPAPQRTPQQVQVGQRVRIVAPGRYGGRTGVVTARRRTRYAVALPGVDVTVPFHLVEPVTVSR